MKRLSGLLSLPVVLALGVLLFFSLRDLDTRRPLVESSDAAEPRYQLVNAEWIRTDVSGEPQFIAEATQISWFEDQSAALRQAELRALGGKSSPWHLRAPQGYMPARSRDLELSGTVEARGRWQDGSALTLVTERLQVDTLQRLLRTDTEVRLDGPGRQLSASGLAADFDGQQIQLLGKVRARYASVPEETTPATDEEAAHAPAL